MHLQSPQEEVTSSCCNQSTTAAGLLYAAYTSPLRGLTVHDGARCVRTASLIGCSAHSSSAAACRREIVWVRRTRHCTDI